LRNKSLTEFTQTLEKLKTELSRIKISWNKNNEMPTPCIIHCWSIFPLEKSRTLPMLVSFYYFSARSPQRNHAQTRWQQAKKRTQIELSAEIKIRIKTQQLKNNTWENS
jgi:hypothetical protein